MAEKQYFPGTCREITTRHGSMLKLGIPATDALKFIQEHANERGWLNLCIAPVRNPTDRRSHTVWLDDYQPEQRHETQDGLIPRRESPISDDSVPPPVRTPGGQENAPHGDDDVPF